MVEVFNLDYDIMSPAGQWNLAEESILNEPRFLKVLRTFKNHSSPVNQYLIIRLGQNLNDLNYALYEDDPEATCRIAIDIILIQARKYVRQKYEEAKSETVAAPTQPITPSKGILSPQVQPTKQKLKLYPESSISVEFSRPAPPNSKIVVTGRADWAVGYSGGDEDGALLVAMEAKQRAAFGSGESQLVAYLAILREKRKRAEKINIVTQGFYSDGNRFAFMSIKGNGSIIQSPTYDTRATDGLNMIFSFVVTMLETAMKSTPTTSPTKPGLQQEQEITNFDENVFQKAYKTFDQSLKILDDDDSMDEVYIELQKEPITSPASQACYLYIDRNASQWTW